MIVADSKLKQLQADFIFFRVNLFAIRRINKLLRLAEGQIPEVFTINGKNEGTSDEILYRSFIYTLFYANYLSVLHISQLEKLSIEFAYLDVKLIVRAIIERCITQKFILTDPVRLSDLFLYWRGIEYKKFHEAQEAITKLSPDSLAMNLRTFNLAETWTTKDEEEYLDCVSKWESLVEPKQKVNKARSWSGYSLAEMAKLTGLEDVYKMTYRETSWYTHSLVSVADFFLRKTKDGLEYGSSTTNLQRLECYFQAEHLFRLTFQITNKALAWNLDKELEMLENEKPSSYAWLWEFIKLRIL